MSESATREVFVLADFTDRDGTVHEKATVFTVAYETERQRQAVNQLMHRGFLTLDVRGAQKHTADPAKAAKKTAAKRAR